jgi:hypothetical protein
MAQTLHEFTLNLLRDEQARSLFAADPTGVLQSAGLGDVTAADVHEILPLVMDFAPTHIVDAFEHSIASEVPGLPTLSGADGAISKLQEIAQHFSSVLPSLPDVSSLPINGLTGALPINGLTGALPTDGLTGALPAVPGLPNLTDPTAALDGVISEVRSLATGVRSLDQVQQLTQAIPVVAEHGLPVVPAVQSLVGSAAVTGAADDVTKTLDSTVHSATDVTNHVPVAGKIIADTTGHVTDVVHAVDVDGVAKIAGDPVHAVTSIGDVSHTLDTVSSTVHVDQVVTHVSGIAHDTVQDLNIGDDNHIGGIGNIDLGGVHVNDVTHNLGCDHLAGF